MHNNDVEDITPPESMAPVYLDSVPDIPAVPELAPEFIQQEQNAKKASGVAKLMALGLTEEEALAIAGG